MKTKVDITNQKFNMLTAVKRDGYIGKDIAWIFKCDCGNTKRIRRTSVTSGLTTSCGCYNKNKKSTQTHGMRKTPEYKAWQDMKSRCYNNNNVSYHYYGTRGISVCDKWLNSFEQFYSDVGKRPGKNYSLDRINNDLNYSPNNVQWVKRHNSNLNSRRKPSNTGIRGVRQTPSGKYEASVCVNKVKHTKRFVELEDAIAQRKAWEKEFYPKTTYHN